MPAISASAPGKAILFGEHAVVYGRPAIAIPLSQVQAKVIVTAEPLGTPGKVHVEAPDIELTSDLDRLDANHPLAVLLNGIRQHLGIPRLPAFCLRIRSTIPIAAGLGSGAAVSVATARAVTAFLGHPLTDEVISQLAYEVEKLYHGTPSGIDNTVVTYARPIYFRRGEPFTALQIAEPFTLVIADSGSKSLTGEVVADVRRQWQRNQNKIEALFDAIAEICEQARQVIEQERSWRLGELMTRNHSLLQELNVSSPELDRLVEAALQAGATGAKLSGAGRGGNMIALTEADSASRVAAALEQAGARRTLISSVTHPLTRE